MLERHVTQTPIAQLFSQDRKKNAYFLGVPLSIMPLATFKIAIRAGSLLTTVTLGVSEVVLRCMGFSQRSFNGVRYSLSKCVNMLGFICQKEKKYKKNLNGIVLDWRDVVDCIGTAMSSLIVSVAVSSFLAPLAFLGISKSNYHRFQYYRYRINELLLLREKGTANTSSLEYHARQLEQCESTTLGNFFSLINLLNLTAWAMYYLDRYVILPFLYGLLKFFSNLCGLLPLMKGVYALIFPKHYDLRLAEDRVSKRFAELSAALDKYGYLPLNHEATALEIEATLTIAKQRTCFTRMGLGLFSSTRKIIALGSTPDEKILSLFKSKFAEFLRVKHRKEEIITIKINTNQFFTALPVENGQRFSYDHMVEQVRAHYFSHADKATVDKIAALVKEEIELAMQDQPKITKGTPNA